MNVCERTIIVEIFEFTDNKSELPLNQNVAVTSPNELEVGIV